MVFEALKVGIIRGAHGIRGNVKVESLSDYAPRFSPGSILYLEKNNQELKIESSSLAGRHILVKFFGIENRIQAEALRGLFLIIPKSRAALLPEGQYYYWQLEGLRVIQDEKELGIIREIKENPANDLYVMEKPNGERVYIPALKKIILKIDLEKGQMTVKLPPGLI